MRPIAAACAGMMCLAGAAYAETASTDAKAQGDGVETVVVTGLKHSIESSVATKREADSIVESVSAEDIGKLPDISIADALSRLPGLAAQRVDGRAQVISIRGLGPKYGVTLLNGREMVSTGDNRSVEYDQFPSELINAATVYKTPDASLSSVGLSGTLNMLSVRPLDFQGMQANASARVETNSNGKLNDGSDNLGNRLSASYINQFADRTIGLALGVAHLDSTGQDKYDKSWWWADTSVWGKEMPGLPAGTIALQGFEAGVTSTNRKRDGLMAVLEYKPDKNFHSMLDMYYSRFDQKKVQSEMQADISSWSGVSYTNPVITNVNGQNVATGGTINNASPVLLNRYNTRQDDIMAIGWNNELKRDKWTLMADLSYSRAKRDEMTAEMTAKPTSPVNFDARIVTGSGISRFTPSQDLSDPSYVLLTEQWGRGGRAQFPNVEDDMKALKLSVKREFEGPVSSVEGGLNFSQRNKDMNRTEVYYYLEDGTPVAIAPNLLRSPASLSFAGIPKILSWNYLGALDQYYTAGTPAALDQAPGRIWNVKEKISTLFGKVNLDVDGKVPVRGNVGVQVVRSDQKSSGLSWNGAETVPVEAGKTYTDVLPSLNLNFDMGNVLSKNTYVRFGAAKEMARPNIEDMRASFSGGVSGSTPYVWSGSGGNPWLEPWRATALDLSIEKYLGKRSYVAAAMFRKNLKSFVYNQDYLFDFSGFPNPTDHELSSNFGKLTIPTNGHGGYVKGFELSAALDAGLVSPALDGFGLIASLSRTDSNLHEENNPNKKLDGLSGTVTGLTLYYEKHGFSARISERYRSEFTTTARDQFNNNVFSSIGSEKIIDFQTGYAIESGPYKGLSILFQVNNLTDEPYRTFVSSSTGGSTVFPERYETYGRQFLLGLTYKLQ